MNRQYARIVANDPRVRRHRSDANQKAILAELRRVPGVMVKPVGLAVDEFDVVVAYRGVNYLFDIKNRAGKNRVQPSQAAFAETWTGQWALAYSAEDILKAIGALK